MPVLLRTADQTFNLVCRLVGLTGTAQVQLLNAGCYGAAVADEWEDFCKQVRGATRTRPIGPQFQGGIAYGVVGEMPS
jgi:hypothetical protein